GHGGAACPARDAVRRAAPRRRLLGVQRRLHALAEIERQGRAGLAAQAVADQVIAAPGGFEFGVVGQPLDQETATVGGEFAVAQGGNLLAQLGLGIVAVVGAHGRTRSAPISGRSFWSMASRARKIRERTVPMGQPMVWAMS